MSRIYKTFKTGRECVLYNGDALDLLRKIPDGYVDLVVSSPPYCMGKEYELSTSCEDFTKAHEQIIPELYRVTAEGGSICWQTGYHVSKNSIVPLDFLAYEIFSKFDDLKLRNRIIWTFGHGFHCQQRFSGRHEVVLWFTKGDSHEFDLDSVRVAQKYPGKRSYKGENRGEFSGNPKGKNPSDVWEIPVVNSSHREKTDHPCQFPYALVQRLVKALTKKEGVVLDPFSGSGTTAAATIGEGRNFVGSEIDDHYCEIARERIKASMAGNLEFRPHDKPIMRPDPNSAVAQKPPSSQW